MGVMRTTARAAVGIIEAVGLSPSVTLQTGLGKGLKLGLAEALRGGYGRGNYEIPVQDELKAHLRPGAVAVDVGANIGFFTVLAAHLVGPEGRVYAIEPVPANAQAVRRNLTRNGFSQGSVLEAGASNVAGRAKLMLAHHPGGATLSEHDTPPDLSGEIEIQTVRLDDLVESGRLKAPDFVKIDVEGFELEVIEGMAQVLRDHGPDLLIEIDGPTKDGLAEKRAKLVATLSRYGYGVRSLPPSYANGSWAVEHLVATRDKADASPERP